MSKLLPLPQGTGNWVMLWKMQFHIHLWWERIWTFPEAEYYRDLEVQQGRLTFFLFCSPELLCVTLNNKGLLRGEPPSAAGWTNTLHMKICASALSLQSHCTQLWTWLWGAAELQRIWLQKDWTTFAPTLKKRSRHCMWVCLVSTAPVLGSGWAVLTGLWLPAQRQETCPRPCSPGALCMQRSTTNTARQAELLPFF